MPSAPSTADVILDGAAQALGRHGARRLTMSDICREAGVSRGTLYRYYKSKDEVLDALNRRIKDTLRSTLDEAIRANPEPADRLRVVLKVLMRTPREFPIMSRLVEREPASAVAFLSRELPEVAKIIAHYLDPVLRDSPPVRDGVVTSVELAEVLQRVISSTILMPTAGSKSIDTRIADLWDSLLPVEGRSEQASSTKHNKATPRARAQRTSA